jgi:hypothetical protein
MRGGSTGYARVRVKVGGWNYGQDQGYRVTGLQGYRVTGLQGYRVTGLR